MQAVAVLPGRKHSVHVRADVPDPRPLPGEAIVRVLEAGLCGTDDEIDEGLYGEAPAGSSYLVLGHENLGVVESSPPGAAVRPGDLVISTVRRACPEACLPCASGRNDMCLTGHFRERGIKGLHGFMSERYAESPDYLVPVPSSLRAIAVLMEPMSIVQKGLDQAWQVQQRLPWAPRRAVVLGAGPIGILAAAALRLRGLEVTVFAREKEGSRRDAFLAEAGIRYASTSTLPLEDVPARLGPMDLAFEATGAPSVVFAATRLLGPDGVCILTSVTAGEKRLEVDVATWNREMVLENRAIFGTVNAARRHFEAGARDFAEAEARLPGWAPRIVTRRRPFTEVREALQRGPNDIKTVLEFA